MTKTQRKRKKLIIQSLIFTLFFNHLTIVRSLFLPMYKTRNVLSALTLRQPPSMSSNHKKKQALSVTSSFLISPRIRPNSLSNTYLPRLHMVSGSKVSSTSMSKSTIPHSQIIQDMLYRIRKCNELPSEITLIDFFVDGKAVGKVTPKVAELLCSAANPPIFQLSNEQNTLELTHHAGTTQQSRTDAVSRVMNALRDSGIIEGWRDELYPVTYSFHDTDPLFLIERAAAPMLGIIQYGVHINGLVRTSDDKVEMWMARRSKTKSKYPGMLDHIVAGGQPHGISPMDNVVKECEEEAGIPSYLALGATPVGGISYETIEEIKTSDENIFSVISRSALFCYDLYLPDDFVPRAVDGEVDEFFKWSLNEVAESMKKDYHDPIKPNCYVCIIDFLLRVGYVTPEMPGYLDVLRELRSGACR